MDAALRLYRSFQRWWTSGPTVPRRWHVYFLCHCVLAVALGVFAVCDSRGVIYSLDRTWSFAVDVMGVVTLLPSIVLSYFAPFLSLRLLWLARHGGPSLVALAVADCAVTGMHLLAMLVGYS